MSKGAPAGRWQSQRLSTGLFDSEVRNLRKASLNFRFPKCKMGILVTPALPTRRTIERLTPMSLC